VSAFFFVCNNLDCLHSKPTKPIKQVATGTGQLFKHLDTCQPAIAQKLRASSKHSPVEIDEDGNEYSLFLHGSSRLVSSLGVSPSSVAP
jgi:hypothetical protein